MLTLKKLSIKAVGRLVEEQTIDFTSLGSLVQVDGVNKNTGGSSGAAKSTIFNSLDYLLGINDIPSSILQSRLTKEGMLVIGSFDLDGKDLTIIRGKGKLSIDLDGEITTGSNKLTEERLDRILGMPRDLFRPMLHKRQREGGFFLQMTPQKTHDFLIDCLGLSDMRLKVSKTETIISTLNLNKAELSSNMNVVESSIKATESAILALGKAPTKNFDESGLLILAERRDKSLLSLEALTNRHKDEEIKLELERPKLQEKQFDRGPWNEYELEVKTINKEMIRLEEAENNRREEAIKTLRMYQDEIYNLNRMIERAQDVKGEASKIAIHIKSIRDCVCPTCEQPWMNEKSKQEEADSIERLRNFKGMISEGDHAKESLASLNRKIEDITPYTQPMITSELKALRTRHSNLLEKIIEERDKESRFNQATFYLNSAILKDFSDRQRAIRERQTLEHQQAMGQANLDRMAYNTALNSFTSYEESKARYDKVLFSLVEQKTNTEKQRSDLVVEHEKLSTLLSFAEESKRALKSFTSCAFDDALSEISDMATRTIRHIPNMANSTIQLEGVRETKDGKLKEEVNAVISSDGEVGIPIKSLSGGERSAVDLAIDLAIINMLEQRTGKGANVFILDEPFTGLDSVSIEMTLEMLKNSNTNKKLILVDHNPEVKQMIDDKITVIREGLVSRIEQ